VAGRTAEGGDPARVELDIAGLSRAAAGSTWTIQALQPKLHQQAEERRRLNEEWLAVRTARRQRGECPRCGSPLSERDWFIAPAVVEDRSDDD
jgi:hypothetical protein